MLQHCFVTSLFLGTNPRAQWANGWMRCSFTWRCTHLGVCCLIIPGVSEFLYWFGTTCPVGEVRVVWRTWLQMHFFSRNLVQLVVSLIDAFSVRFPASVLIICVFCCLAEHRNILLPLHSNCFLQACSRTALPLWPLRPRGGCASRAPAPHH